MNTYIPDTDAVIELGGEDAKIIFFGEGGLGRTAGTFYLWQDAGGWGGPGGH